jgi:Flp pilus assembly protein CpaB
MVMLLAGVLGLVLNLAVLRGRGASERVLVASRDLEVGTVVRPGDLRSASLRDGDGLASRLVPANRESAVRGHVITAPTRAGDPILASQLRARATDDGRRAMSIPVDRARAVDGRLVPGDRVDVVVAGDGVARVVAADLEVLDVDDGEHGAFGARQGQVTLTLAVDVDDAQLLAIALADGDFVLTRVTGSPSARGAAPVTIDPVPAR